MGRYVNRIILSLRRQRSYNNKRYENRKNSSTTTKTTQRPRKHTETQQYNTGSDWVKTTPPLKYQYFSIFQNSTIKFNVYTTTTSILCTGEISNVRRLRTWQPSQRIDRNTMALLPLLPLTAGSPRVHRQLRRKLFLKIISFPLYFHYFFQRERDHLSAPHKRTLHSHRPFYSLLPSAATSQGVLVRWNPGTDR